MAAGVLLALIGIPVILTLPVTGGARAAAVGLWVAWSAWELLLVWRAYQRCRGYRLSSEGDVLVLEAVGSTAAQVLPGSLILSEIAWLRIRDEHGRIWGELVRGKHRESEEWRRFQVIFRHLNTC